MSRLFLCHPLWSGSFLLYAVFCLIALVFFVLFVIQTVVAADKKKSMKICFRGITVTLYGHVLCFVMCLFMVVLILLYPSIDHWFGFDVTPYSQHMDINVKTSLKTLLGKFEGYSTNREIHLDPAIEELEIEGEYDGECVADMFYAICLRHPDKLSCDWPRSEPVLYVRSK